MTQIKLGDIPVDVLLKDIKNIHLSVYPPTGRVRISAPSRTSLDTIRVFAVSKIGWIKAQQRKFQEQQRETPREYLDLESHFLWGKRHLLQIIDGIETPSVQLKHRHIFLRVRAGADKSKKQAILEGWYRQQLKQKIPPLLEKWQEDLGVQVAEWGVKKMKTKWGTCNPRARRIWVNLELVKKPAQCLEFIVVHELVHLIERHHNDRFVAIMDKHLPKWRLCRADLAAAPLAHDIWEY